MYLLVAAIQQSENTNTSNRRYRRTQEGFTLTLCPLLAFLHFNLQDYPRSAVCRLLSTPRHFVDPMNFRFNPLHDGKHTDAFV